MENKVNYHLWSAAIKPSKISTVNLPCEANPRYEDGYLPIFTAPMDSVVTTENFRLFEKNGIHTVLPRTTDILLRLQNMKEVFCAFTADEVKMHLVDQNANRDNNTIHVCIDELNGNTERILRLSKGLRDKYGDTIKIMVGNIGNAETYKNLAIAGVDYVRLGNGVSNESSFDNEVGIFTPFVTLIQECREVARILSNGWSKSIYEKVPYIIADGGMSEYGEYNKALALGADFVMLGYPLVACLESAADTFFKTDSKEKVDQYSNEAKERFLKLREDFSVHFHKKIYAYYSKKGQLRNGINFPMPELGYDFDTEVKNTLEEFVSKFEYYLQIAMHFCNAKKLSDFIGKPEIIIKS